MLAERISEMSARKMHWRSLDFSSVTEQPGLAVTREAISMLSTRYSFAASHCSGKDVLEVACGAGMGLGLLSKCARSVVAGDITQSLVRLARDHYVDAIPLLRFDAHSLPFSAASFDVIVLFEAIYYLADADQFICECRRVLRPGGCVFICTANPERDGFNPSPYSRRYYSCGELRRLFERNGFAAEIHGAFPTRTHTRRQRLAVPLRNAAARLRLFPRTMRGKALLKRIFYGPLARINDEIPASNGAGEPIHRLLPDGNAAGFKVLYAVARCANGKKS